MTAPINDLLPARVGAVLAVLHLLFTTGSTAPSGAGLVRHDLVTRARELARRRLGRRAEALLRTENQVERAFLERRLAGLEADECPEWLVR